MSDALDVFGGVGAKSHITQSRVVAGAGHAARAAGAAAMTGRRGLWPPATPPGQSSQCSLWSAYLYPYARAPFCKLGRKGNEEKNIEIRKH